MCCVFHSEVEEKEVELVKELLVEPLQSQKVQYQLLLQSWMSQRQEQQEQVHSKLLLLLLLC